MIKNYKKGDVLWVKHRVPFTDNMSESVGILYKKSKISVVIIHNFFGSSPVDSVKIFVKDIIKIHVVIPMEINSINDFSKVKND